MPTSDLSQTGGTKARIGPNSLIQTAAVLSDRFGRNVARAIFESAGLGREFAGTERVMVPEEKPQRLFRCVCDTCGPTLGRQVLADAGDRTALYLLEYRIPPLAQALLGLLPLTLSARLLVRAIARHAWTFAGSGVFTAHVKAWRRPTIQLEIRSNPLATDGCPWHQAVIARLFSTILQHPVDITHHTCCARGNECCRWEIRLATPQAR